MLEIPRHSSNFPSPDHHQPDPEPDQETRATRETDRLPLPLLLLPKSHALRTTNANMGLPYLLKRLKAADLTSTQVFGRTGDQTHSRAIIDGPSFAHYVLYKLQLHQTADNVLGARCTYTECAAEAPKWLQELESYGYKV